MSSENEPKPVFSEEQLNSLMKRLRLAALLAFNYVDAGGDKEVMVILTQVEIALGSEKPEEIAFAETQLSLVEDRLIDTLTQAAFTKEEQRLAMVAH